MDLQTTIYLVVGLSFALYIGIAFWARAGSTSEFYAAGGSGRIDAVAFDDGTRWGAEELDARTRRVSSGDDNLVFGIGVGPSLGVEYYIGDRLSLTALYQMVLQLAYQQAGSSSSVTAFSFSTLAGGAMTLTYYF